MTSYIGFSPSQNRRNKILQHVRRELGNEMFAEFIIHTLSDNNQTNIEEYSSLAALWLKAKALKVVLTDSNDKAA
jgi:hypothetical protein